MRCDRHHSAVRQTEGTLKEEEGGMEEFRKKKRDKERDKGRKREGEVEREREVAINLTICSQSKKKE